MRAYSRPLMLLAALLSLNSCNKSKSTKSSGELPLTVIATIGKGAISTVQNGVKANGTNVVTINITGASQGPITVTTTKGVFANGDVKTTIDGTSGSVDLTTCDASKDATCADSVTVTAISGNFGMGTVSLKFIGFETICNDGLDNNDDNRIDCADPDCDLQACVLSGTVGTCQNLACVPPVCTPNPASPTTEICNNNIDDDCDGKIDCAQSSCDGQPCNANDDSWICKSGTCNDVTSGFGLTVAPKRTRLPADGTSTTTVTVTLTSQGSAQANTSLTLTVSPVGSGSFVTNANVKPPTTSQTITVSTGSDGTVTATFLASTSSGTATITAALVAVPQVNQKAYITMPALGSIMIGSIQNPVMGVKYSGWNEQNQISVLLLDTEQKPYPDGLDVSFVHQQVGGSTISIPATNGVVGSCSQNITKHTVTCDGQTSSPVGSPDTQGLAYVNLYSGTAAGLVSISVTATAGSATRNYTIHDIAIVGAKVSGAHISLECWPKNIPAFTQDTDCLNTYYVGPESPIHCTAYFADRFNNVLGKQTKAIFASEAGAAGQPVDTNPYDPTKTDDQTANLGFAANTIAVTGYKIPNDVPPVSGEPVYDLGVGNTDECGVQKYNPRDGLSTIIVMAKGEEGFLDLNGNGVWDTGEPFIDQGEPYVDANDNHQWDSGEDYFDANGNGQYDGPNGQWDADTTVWTETRVLYTGSPAIGVNYSRVIGDLGGDSVSVKSSAGGGTATTDSVTYFFVDRNKNSISPKATSYTVNPEYGNCTAKIIFTPTTVDNLGMNFNQVYCKSNPITLKPDLTVCSNICPLPFCQRVTMVGGYDYNGYADVHCYGCGKMSITGGSNAALGDYVDITPKVDSITYAPGLQVTVIVDGVSP